MRVLICVSGNAPGYTFERTQVFVYEQIEAVCKAYPEVEYQVFSLKGHGMKGYLGQVRALRHVMREYKPDVVHAHCGQMGLFANLQRQVPVITTFHGSDVNVPKLRLLSRIAMCLSAYNLFISNKLLHLGCPESWHGLRRHCTVLPCGVDYTLFRPRAREECRQALGIDMGEHYVLFCSAFDNEVKNVSLAREVMLHFPHLTLREIKNRSREEVAQLIGGAELLLMTSHSEGSPQIVKEAVAMGQRVVSVDVGDVREQLEGLIDCAVCEATVPALVQAMNHVLSLPHREMQPNSRFDNSVIARQLMQIYRQVAGH